MIGSNQLLRPKRAYVAPGKREWTLDAGDFLFRCSICVLVLERAKIKGIVDYIDIDIYSLEITGQEAIPDSDRFPDTLRCSTLLYAVVANARLGRLALSPSFIT